MGKTFSSKTLRDKLGYDLRQTTGTSNLDEAILKRDQIVQEFRDVINTEKNLLENSKPSKDISVIRCSYKRVHAQNRYI